MARIRSVHPGLATDEAFMAASMPAKAAWELLWTECDDHGVFEWKPLVLKARILPADAVDFAAILAEYASLNMVQKFEVDGKSYGAVRNFGKFQKPKKPKYTYPLPDELRTYVASGGLGTEPKEPDDDKEEEQAEPEEGEVGNRFRTGGVQPPQMEEGGGSRKKKETEPNGSGGKPVDETRLAIDAYNATAKPLGWPEARLTDQRRPKLRQRLAECGGLAGWRDAMARASKSPFLRGETGRQNGHESWRPDLDFFLHPQKLTRLIEGAYDARKKPAEANDLEGVVKVGL